MIARSRARLGSRGCDGPRVLATTIIPRNCSPISPRSSKPTLHRSIANVRLWRGFPLPLITISIVRTISFSIYSATKRILNSEPGTVENTTDASGKTPWINLRLGILNKDSTLDVALTSLLAGAASGAVVCVGSAPFELVKVGCR